MSKAIGIYNLQTDEFEAYECPECQGIIKDNQETNTNNN